MPTIVYINSVPFHVAISPPLPSFLPSVFAPSLFSLTLEIQFLCGLNRILSERSIGTDGTPGSWESDLIWK